MSTPPRVLVVVASRHGATAEIGEAIARGVVNSPAGRAGELMTVYAPAQQRSAPTSFDAVVLGSAVYAGRWLDEARSYASVYADLLRKRPVWLFSSGPIGEAPFPPDEPYDAAPIAALIGAREHRVLPGRLDKARLSFGERAMVTAMRAPLGDFRDWAAVDAWAAEIAIQVGGGVPAGQA
jgi:menaquinone-dependent protoporphyrinogen oxidase